MMDDILEMYFVSGLALRQVSKVTYLSKDFLLFGFARNGDDCR